MKPLYDFFHHILVPQEKNDYRARSLHPDILSYYLVFAIVLTFFVRYINGNFSNVLGFATDISIPKLYELTNKERANNGLSDLHYNNELAAAAQKKAQDMFAKGYWAHFAPDGTTPWSFILASGYQYEFAGENLAKNFMFSQGVVDAWMNSPSHRENILRKDYSDVGYAIVNGVLNGEETTLVVQMFGKPLSSSVAINEMAKPIAAQTRTEQLSPTLPVAAATVAPISVAPTAQISSPYGQTIVVPTSAPVILGNHAPSPLNLLPTLFSSNLIFFLFLLTAIAMDFYFAARLNVIRVGSKHVAHFIFIGFIIAGLLMTLIKGAIL